MKYVRKTSGEKEPFDIHKLKQSLERAHVKPPFIKEILKAIKEKSLKTTKEIHEEVFNILKTSNRPSAGRYNLKRALLELGPAGFPFEHFVNGILEHEGYDTKMNVYLEGACIDHEIDIIAHKKDQNMLVECKFHNSLGIKTDVKVTLYIKARYEDIQLASKQNKNLPHFQQSMIASNTQFTSKAIKYAECADLKLLGWGYPKHNDLPHLIDKYHLHPITTVTMLTKKQKKQLIKNGLVFCRQASEYRNLLKKIGFSQRVIDDLVAESEAICTLE